MQGTDKLHLQLIKAHLYFRFVHKFHKFFYLFISKEESISFISYFIYIKRRVHKFPKFFIYIKGRVYVVCLLR